MDGDLGSECLPLCTSSLRICPSKRLPAVTLAATAGSIEALVAFGFLAGEHDSLK